MADTRIPKQVFHDQLSAGDRMRDGKLKRYKGHHTASFKAYKMNSDAWKLVAAGRTLWRSVHRSAVETFEKARLDHLAEKRFQCKNRITKPDNRFICNVYNHACASYTRQHVSEIRRVDDLLCHHWRKIFHWAHDMYFCYSGGDVEVFC